MKPGRPSAFTTTPKFIRVKNFKTMQYEFFDCLSNDLLKPTLSLPIPQNTEETLVLSPKIDEIVSSEKEFPSSDEYHFDSLDPLFATFDY